MTVTLDSWSTISEKIAPIWAFFSGDADFLADEDRRYIAIPSRNRQALKPGRRKARDKRKRCNKMAKMSRAKNRSR
jgi:hypothetical protein